jgi:hypothetical protein
LEVRARSPKRNVSDSAYCQARAKLEDSLLERIASSISSKAAAKVGRQALWLGREVKSVDGTGMRMPDTPENQASFPQPSTQKSAYAST